MTTAQNVEVEMIHLLSPHSSGVNDGAKALVATLIPGKPSGGGEEPAQHRLVLRPYLGQGVNVDLGNQQKMHGSKRMEIVEGQNLVVLVDFPGGNLAASDAAEDAITHGPGARSASAAGLLLVDAGDAFAAPEFDQHIIDR